MNRRIFLRNSGIMIAGGWIMPLTKGNVVKHPDDLAFSHGKDDTTMQYQEDKSIFPNPERGWYVLFSPPGGGNPGNWKTPHAPFKAAVLKKLRQDYEGLSLIRENIQLGPFTESDISQEYLDQIQKDWDTVREAGFKVVPRFIYLWGMTTRDADESFTVRHLEQLQPLLERNKDIIAWVQPGLFGGCGEGQSSEHGQVVGFPQRLTEKGVRIYKKVLQVVPKERMVTFRFPRYKWDFFGWNSETCQPLTSEDAFTGTDKARIGYANQGYMGDVNSYAMFRLQNEKSFAEKDAAFVVMEGEVSAARPFNMEKGTVLSYSQSMHQMCLTKNQGDARNAYQAWKDNGDYDEVCRRLGYRFRLFETTASDTVKPGNLFSLAMKITNDGWSNIVNPRKVQVLLRNKRTKELFQVEVKGPRENRLWLPFAGETKDLVITAGIPANMVVGTYELFLNLPDPMPRIKDRPEYSIRMANVGMWEADTGFNRLLHEVKVDHKAAGQRYNGDVFFQKP